MVAAMQRLVLSLAAGLLLATSSVAAAQQGAAPGQGVNRLGGAKGWDAYIDTVKGGKICYLIGKPSKSEPAGAKRSAIFASVTHRPGEKRLNEVNFNSGYLFKEGSNAELAVDGKKFSLFTEKEGAWTRDAASDKALVEALAKGREAVIKGVSARGTATTDTYSLDGFTQALSEIDKACGVKR
jgi:hypothetical protein